MDAQVCGWGVGSRVISATKKANSLAYFEVVVTEHCQISPIWRDGKGIDVNKPLALSWEVRFALLVEELLRHKPL